MKTNLFALIMCANVALFAQTSQTASMGAGYANDVYYSFATGVVKTETRANWHLGFNTSLMSASVLTNEGQGVELYDAGVIANFATIDTTGMTWNALHNGAKTWEDGAFNANQTGHPNYGWGVYNNITHNIGGTKVFIIKLSPTDVRKIAIDAMTTNGDYNFRIANLDGTGLITKTVNKMAYNTKNFVYYDILADVIVDREPAKTAWDVVFTKYQEQVVPGMYYPVVGALLNYTTPASKAKGVDVTTVDWNNYNLKDSIQTIGSTWKSFNNTTFMWTIEDSLAYFVKANDGNLYEVLFTGFGGSTTGDIMFDQRIASAVGIAENDFRKVDMYPQPAKDYVVVQATAAANLSIYNMSGALVSQNTLAAGENRIALQLKAGVYVVRMIENNNLTTARLVIL